MSFKDWLLEPVWHKNKIPDPMYVETFDIKDVESNGFETGPVTLDNGVKVIGVKLTDNMLAVKKNANIKFENSVSKSKPNLLRCSLHMTAPLSLEDEKGIATLVKKGYNLTEELIASGYDGIIHENKNGNIEVVAFFPEKIHITETI